MSEFSYRLTSNTDTPQSIVLSVFELLLRVTPPFLVRSIQGVFRRYAVRNGSVRKKNLLYRTQTSIFTFKRSNFHQETQQT